MDKSLILNKNSKLIIENIIENDSISQNEIANQTSINRSIVSKEVAILEQNKIIKISSSKNKKILKFNHEFVNTIIIEIDRYFIHGFLNTGLGYNIDSIQIKMDILEVSDLFNEIEKIINTFLAKSSKTIIGIGFSVHGIVNNENSITYAPNTKWHNLDLKHAIEEKYEIPTYIINSANVCAITEKIFTQPNIHSILSINIHSGVGAGFIFSDELFIGNSGNSLEFGHFNILGHSKKCDCGSIGCLETEISYPNIITKMQNLNIEEATIENLITLYNANDERAINIYNEYIDLLSFGMRNLFLVIDPQKVKINCQIIQSIPKSIEIIKAKIYSPIIQTTDISSSKLNSQTRCIGLSTEICKDYFNLHSINLNNSKDKIIKSFEK